MMMGTGSIFGTLLREPSVTFVCDTIAVKKILPDSFDLAICEIIAMKLCNHPCVLSNCSIKITDDFTTLIYMRRYCIDLEHAALTVVQKYSVTSDFISGVAHIHSAGLIHGDLKPANILLERLGDDFHAVVCDFGLTCADESIHYSPAHPLEYRAPEIGYGPSYKFTNAVDCWALGCLMLRLSLDRSIVYNENDELMMTAASLDSSMVACMILGLNVADRTRNLVALYSLSNKELGSIIRKKYPANVYRMYRDSGYVSLIRQFLRPKSNCRLDAASALSTIQRISSRTTAISTPRISISDLNDSCNIFEGMSEDLIIKCSPECRKLANYLHITYGQFNHGNYAALYAAAEICTGSTGVLGLIDRLYPDNGINQYVAKLLLAM